MSGPTFCVPTPSIAERPAASAFAAASQNVTGPKASLRTPSLQPSAVSAVVRNLPGSGGRTEVEGTAARPPLPEVWATAGWNPTTDPIVVIRRSKRMMFSEFFMLLLRETVVTGVVARVLGG